MAAVTRLAAGVIAGSRIALSRAITLVESSRPGDYSRAAELFAELTRLRGPQPAPRAFRLGVTGPPGAGKSTFIEAFGRRLIDEGGRLAVLAVDPSSQTSGGSILGDKTRMHELSLREEAYVRPSPASGTLGGVALRTHDAALLCEAAGYDHIAIETVGVGQSEVEVAHMVDCVLVLLPPGGGDGLQAIKRGLIEHADVIAVTKADGELRVAAGTLAREYSSAIALLRPRWRGWRTPVTTCSSHDRDDVGRVLALVREFRAAAEESGQLARNRSDQELKLLLSAVQGELAFRLRTDPRISALVLEQHRRIVRGEIAPRVAAEALCERFIERMRA
jgi:LAO/AO transport system kinase